MKKSIRTYLNKAKILLIAGFVGAMAGGCKKLIEIDAPVTSINEENVYTSDATAISAVTGIYALMSNGGSPSTGFTGTSGISVLAGLSADELSLYNAVNDTRLIAYYRNALVARPFENYGPELWTVSYSHIFTCNAAIAGLSAPSASALSPQVRQQLLGEVKFMRAFFYFYMLTLYDNVPLVLSTDPNANSSLPQDSKDNVIRQIITDLTEASGLLNVAYLNGSLVPYSGTAERVRPNRWAAQALLARAYLYNGEYAAAEAAATAVIGQTALFAMPPLNEAFLKNSRETIWALQPVKTGRNTDEAFIFVLPPTGPTANAGLNPVYLSPQLLGAFEPGDQRRYGRNWVDSVTVLGITYHFPNKYKAVNVAGSVTEYLVMFRLAEQYLIRAEARAMQNNTSGTQSDINAIRSRAGLSGTTATDQTTLIAAVMRERQRELFTELGHRWLDLKRYGTINTVMATVAPQKGGVWNANWQRYPIPFDDLQKNTKLRQNQGY